MSGSAERYGRLHAVFEGARELAGEERRAYVAARCDGDEELRREVEELLDALESRATDAFSEKEIARGRRDFERFAAEASGGAQESEPLVPARIGPYRILRRHGEGGMGIVYEAEQDSPRRRIALKVVHPLFANETRVKRLRQEAELLGRLRHPGIAQIHEAGTFDLGRGAQPYFAMEFIVGTDLATYARERRLLVPARLELLARVADAVQHAHEQGVVHRDLKPDNVLVDAHGQPKVLDFGIARATEGSSVLTTLVTAQGDLLEEAVLEKIGGVPCPPSPGSPTMEVRMRNGDGDDHGAVTRLLRRIRAGDADAQAQLVPLVDAELQQLARAFFSNQRPGHTLQPTALVNEAWLKLAGKLAPIDGRRHFLVIAGKVMRQILADHARARMTSKRGGGQQRVALDAGVVASSREVDPVELDDCLNRLADCNARHARVVELRVFSGLTFGEIAEELGLSRRSIDSDWAMAKSWLQKELAAAP